MNSINIIDIEASGLHFDSYPIEVAVLVDGRRKSWLIKPEPKWQHWCNTAESMHGITREMLQKEGIEAARVAIELNEFLSSSKAVLYSDAAYWDAGWMDTLYFSVNQIKQFHVDSIFNLLNEVQQAQFNIEKERLTASGKYRHHRAGADVEIINEVFKLVIAQS
ncbi:MAG: hypothetical protein V4660_17640 [Pseudomonadota bacterium]